MEGGIYTLICKKVGEIVILSVCESFLRMTGCYFFPQNFILSKKIKKGKENIFHSLGALSPQVKSR